MTRQVFSMWEVYRQSWHLSRQTRISCRKVMQLKSARLTLRQRFSAVKSYFQDSQVASVEQHHQAMQQRMLMRIMLLSHEGYAESLEATQENIKSRQDQYKALGLIFDHWLLGRLRSLLPWILLFLLSIVVFLKLQPGLSHTLWFWMTLEGVPGFLTLAFVLGLIEFQRRLGFVDRIAELAMAFYSEDLPPEEVFGRALAIRQSEIRRMTLICSLADWLLPMIILLWLTFWRLSSLWWADFLFWVADLSSTLILVIIAAQIMLPVYVVLLLKRRIFMPFQIAVWTIVYSNWRSQHWREG